MKRTRARFKRGDRVEWDEDQNAGPGHPKVLRTGAILDTHKLGGWGYHYEVQPDTDHDGVHPSIELDEAALRTRSILERMAEAADPMRTGLKRKPRRAKR